MGLADWELGGANARATPIDRNGLDDLVVCNGNGVCIHRQIAPGVFVDSGLNAEGHERLPEMPVSSQLVTGITVGDIDGDGVPEILCCNNRATAGCPEARIIALSRNPQPCSADLAEPFGVLNFFDIAAFLESCEAGCP
ncbi:MAG: VCBS repeat-containing protein [Planctomycetota bacterium]